MPASPGQHLARKRIHPDRTVTHRFPPARACEVYRIFAMGKTGRVCATVDWLQPDWLSRNPEGVWPRRFLKVVQNVDSLENPQT